MIVVRAARRNGDWSSDVAHSEIILWIHRDFVCVLSVFRWYSRGKKMVLCRRHPAALKRSCVVAVLFVFQLQRVIALTVENGWAAKRIGLDVEVRTFHMFVVANDLHVGGCSPCIIG